MQSRSEVCTHYCCMLVCWFSVGVVEHCVTLWNTVEVVVAAVCSVQVFYKAQVIRKHPSIASASATSPPSPLPPRFVCPFPSSITPVLSDSRRKTAALNEGSSDWGKRLGDVSRKNPAF
jgi:hypothetical protein